MLFIVTSITQAHQIIIIKSQLWILVHMFDVMDSNGLCLSPVSLTQLAEISITA